MRYIFLIVSMFAFSSFSMNTSIEDIRAAYLKANDSKKASLFFLNLTENVDRTNDPVIKGYYGCAIAMQAAYANGVFKKMSVFKKGKNILEEAIKEDPNNIELRMIRLAIQYNTPSIAGYKGAMDKDKKFILSKADQVESESLKIYVDNFIEKSGIFN